jgi:long-chain acyl-CoA synthetase
MMSVPALAKNFRKNIENGIQAKGEKVKKLFDKALKVAYAYNRLGYDKGKGLQLWNLILYKIYDKLIFSKIRANFGGNLEFFIGGGAILDIELQKFFYAIGIPMLQGYGLTEASPIISANSMLRHKLGTSGYLVKNLEIKIIDEQGNLIPNDQNGEICVKGENIMLGYWKNPKSTDETLRDGWLHTGDLGHLDKDGFISVLGRYKSLLISNDGEKYSPEGIEEALIEKSKYIDQCLLYNNQNAYTVCLLVPNISSLSSELRNQNMSFETEQGICTAFKLIKSEIDEFKPGGKFENIFPPRWLPAATAILDQSFTEQNHFLNSTLKVVRSKITDHYKSPIEFLYSPEAKDICNNKNQKNIKLLMQKN